MLNERLICLLCVFLLCNWCKTKRRTAGTVEKKLRVCTEVFVWHRRHRWKCKDSEKIGKACEAKFSETATSESFRNVLIMVRKQCFNWTHTNIHHHCHCQVVCSVRLQRWEQQYHRAFLFVFILNPVRLNRTSFFHLVPLLLLLLFLSFSYFSFSGFNKIRGYPYDALSWAASASADLFKEGRRRNSVVKTRFWRCLKVLSHELQ